MLLNLLHPIALEYISKQPLGTYKIQFFFTSSSKQFSKISGGVKHSIFIFAILEQFLKALGSVSYTHLK